MVAIAYLSREKGWTGKPPPSDHSCWPLTKSGVPSEVMAQENQNTQQWVMFMERKLRAFNGCSTYYLGQPGRDVSFYPPQKVEGS